MVVSEKEREVRGEGRGWQLYECVGFEIDFTAVIGATTGH
jgi:hypothetical protein